MRHFFIMNPGSRGGKSKKMFARFFRLLAERGIRYEYKTTENLADAYTFSREANRSGRYDVITAFGGDGTVNHVLNGFYDEQGKRISGVKMGIAYTGTSPDICRHYNIPIHDLPGTVEVLQQGRSSKVEIGRVTLAGEYNPAYIGRRVDDSPLFRSRYFFGAVNIGIGATVAKYANSGIRKILGDFAGTLLSLLKTLAEYKPVTYEVLFDGEKKEIHSLLNLIIGKLFYVASGIKVKNRLLDGDKEFYCLVMKNFKFRRLPRMLDTLYSGKEIVPSEMFSLDYIHEVEVKGHPLSPEVEFDGDPGGFLPCRIRGAEESLDLVVG